MSLHYQTNKNLMPQIKQIPRYRLVDLFTLLGSRNHLQFKVAPEPIDSKTGKRDFESSEFRNLVRKLYTILFDPKLSDNRSGVCERYTPFAVGFSPRNPVIQPSPPIHTNTPQNWSCPANLANYLVYARVHTLAAARGCMITHCRLSRVPVPSFDTTATSPSILEVVCVNYGFGDIFVGKQKHHSSFSKFDV